MNYTLQELQDLISRLIEREGADAPCVAWLCTAEDIDDIVDEAIYRNDPELTQRILTNVSNLPDNYIFTQIQDCVRHALNDERDSEETSVGVGTT